MRNAFYYVHFIPFIDTINFMNKMIRIIMNLLILLYFTNNGWKIFSFYMLSDHHKTSEYNYGRKIGMRDLHSI